MTRISRMFPAMATVAAGLVVTAAMFTSREVAEIDGLMLAKGGLIAAFVFAFRAAEARYPRVISIFRASQG